MSTPLMKQYSQVKAKYPGTILLFRMGDFFETFEEDAVITSKVLGITLTRRGNGTAGEVPLAGFPHHALDTYLPKLLRAGYRVAVCEQLEDPKFATGIVKRDVIEVVTPGVAFSDKVLEQKRNNYLAAISFPSAVAAADTTVGFAFIDVSTAEFRTCEFPLNHLQEQVAALDPAEILVQKRDEQAIRKLLERQFSGLYTPIDDWVWNIDYATDILTDHFQTHSLKGFGVESFHEAIVAAGAIMNYLRETQKSNLLHITRLTRHDVGEYIVLDPSTKRNLEITSSIAGAQEGTLFAVLDKTSTPMGSRLLKRWINQPLNCVNPIRERLRAVGELVAQPAIRTSSVKILSSIGDLERLNTRICTGRATPRDLIALRVSLEKVESLRHVVKAVSSEALAAIRDELQALPEIVSLIDRAIEPDPPASLADGGVIRTSYNSELDEIRTIAHSGKQWIADLQKKERERTGISSLKVGFNNVFGY